MANKVPQIRFEGFTDPWEQRKLSEISDVRDGTHDSPSYLSAGHPFVTSKNVKEGYINYDDIQYISDEDFEAINKRSKVDVNDILMGMIGTIGNLALIRTEPDFAIKNVALIKDTKQVSYMYLYHYLQSPSTEQQLLSGLDGGTQKFVSLKNIRELNIMVPSETEQIKVGTFMESLDNLITLHQRKYEKLQIIKKALLEKMFPQNGSSVPEIRFDGFTDPWEQCKLGDIIDKLTGGASIAQDDYAEEGYRTIPKGAVNDTGVADMSGCKCVSEAFYQKNISSKTSAGELVTSLRDLVPTAPNLGRIVRIYGDSEDFLMPQGVYSIVLKKNSDEDFLIAYSNSPDYRRIITTEKNGSTQVHIRNGEFLNIDILVPSYEEQKIIGATIRNLDNLITLHQRKCEKLRIIKKSLLEKMFVD